MRQQQDLSRGKARDAKRRVKMPTPESLANGALFYLGRYAASEASLRRVLENKLRRAAMADENFAADVERQAVLRQAIESIIAVHKKAGVINDAAFAEMKVRSLRRSGSSARRISQKLTVKGIAPPLIDHALTAHADDEGGDVERSAARAFAKKRALGPFRAETKRATAPDAVRDQTRKDYAALARAGFSFDVIRDVLQTALDTVPEWESF